MTDTETAPTLADLLATYKAVSDAEAAVKADKAELRGQIDAILRAEYEATGTLSTHRLAGVGSTWLGGGGPVARVSQPQTFANWCAEHYPDAVTFVIEIPRKVVDSDDFQRLWTKLQLLASDTSSWVEDGLLEAIAKAGTLDTEAGRVITAEGEVVEGVTAVNVEPTLFVKPSKDKPANGDHDGEAE